MIGSEKFQQRWTIPGILPGFLIIAVTAIALMATNVGAQQPEKSVEIDASVLKKRIDHREEMRSFIRSISTFARQQKPGFVIIPMNGLDLLTRKSFKTRRELKKDTTRADQLIVKNTIADYVPIRTFLNAIDGMMSEALFIGGNYDDGTLEEDIKREKKILLELATLGKNSGLPVFVTDYVKTPAQASESIRLNAANGFVPYPARNRSLKTLPPVTSKPFAENAKSILSLRDARNFIFLRDSSSFGREDEYSLRVRKSSHDLVVVDVFHRGKPLSKRAVETMKYKRFGARRMVLARLDIGSASAYHYYWKDEWTDTLPSWIAAEFPDDPERFYINYWDPEWQSIVAGDGASYIAGIIDLGFDGVVLEGADAYAFFTGDDDSW